MHYICIIPIVLVYYMVFFASANFLTGTHGREHSKLSGANAKPYFFLWRE